MNARLVWATPEAEQLLARIARVSNPENQENPTFEGLLRYMIRHEHWSPFEMVSACVEIDTTRDIARQILRHRSFSFQEFSQRYAQVDLLPAAPMREARMQDTKNRQSSLPCDDEIARHEWRRYQNEVFEHANAYYRAAVGRGIAKEVARALLPEGLTPSRLYMAGTLRSWMHYLKVRTHPTTQQEHREIATAIATVLRVVFPTALDAYFDTGEDVTL